MWTYPDRASFVEKMKPAYRRVGQLAGEDTMQELLKAVRAAIIGHNNIIKKGLRQKPWSCL